MPEFYMILARKINKIPEFYMIFARKMSTFFILIARKIFFPNFRGHVPPASPPFPTPMPMAAYRLKHPFNFSNPSMRRCKI